MFKTRSRLSCCIHNNPADHCRKYNAPGKGEIRSGEDTKMKKGLLKRVIALLTVVVLIAGFAFPVGASDESGSSEEILSEEESEEIVTTPEPTAEPTAEPTEEPTPEPTEEPTYVPTSEPEPTSYEEEAEPTEAVQEEQYEEQSSEAQPVETPQEEPVAAPTETPTETPTPTVTPTPDDALAKLKAASAKPKKAGETPAFLFGGLKKITGRTSTDKQFIFQLTKEGNTEPEEKTTSGTITQKDGIKWTFSAGNTDFDDSDVGKTINYTVSEKPLTNPEGWTIDSTQYNFGVKVGEVIGDINEGEELKAQRYLVAESIKAASGKLRTGDLTISSQPGTDEDPASVTISADKIQLTETEFNSKVYQIYVAGSKADLVMEDGKLNPAAGTPVEIKKGKGLETDGEGTYKFSYTVEGISPDTTKYVVVADSESVYPLAALELKGTKHTVVEGEGTAEEKAVVNNVAYWILEVIGAEFTNTYKITEKVTKTISFSKAIKGTPPDDKSFHFTMDKASRIKKKKDGHIYIDDKEISPKHATIVGQGKSQFSRTFSQTGKYYYYIAEDEFDYKNYTRDNTIYYITYIATDNGKGGLNISEKITKGSVNSNPLSDVIFTNVYKEPTPPTKKPTPTPTPKPVTGTVKIHVRDSGDDTAITGASYAIYGIKAAKGTNDYKKAQNNLKKGTIKKSQLKKLKTVDSADGVVSFTKLSADTYYAVEEEGAASGYQKSANAIVIKTASSGKKLTYEVIDSGDETVYTDDSGAIIWPQLPTTVLIYMRSSTGALLTNARLTLTDNTTGDVVDSWKSEGSAHEVDYLVAGRKYTVKQTNRLVGYTQASPVTFTVAKKDVKNTQYEQTVTVVSKKTATARTSTTTRKTGTTGTTGRTGTSTSARASNRTTSAKTNDASPIIPLAVAMVAAAAVIFLVLRKKKK